MCARRKKKNHPLTTFLAIVIIAVLTYYGKDTIGKDAPHEVARNEAFVEPVSDLQPGSVQSETVVEPLTHDKKLLPSYLTDRPEEIVFHDGFVLSYNRKHLVPNWVSWLLTAERTKGKEKRADNFQPDTAIAKGPVAEDSDYRRSGYDRGHMCPAADCKHSRASQNACFLLSNISPQTHALNAGDWKQLEELSRKWAQRYDSLYIVCGPVIEPGKKYESIGANGVTVPKRYFKVIWRNTPDGSAHAVGFIFENSDQNRPLSAYAVTVDQVEEVTGINFFSKFPKNTERNAESAFDLKVWKGLE